MKVKARDIIPGWPRGHSTTPDNHLQDLEWKVFWQIRFNWGINYDKRSLDEAKIKYKIEYEYETTYHQMQAAMVNEFRKGGIPVHANNQISLSLDDL